MIKNYFPYLSATQLTPESQLVHTLFPAAPAESSLPAAFSPVKAAIILDRAQALDKDAVQALAEAVDPSRHPKAAEVLVSINSVLQDVSSKQLKDIPNDILHSLAGIIFDQHRHGSDPWSVLEGITTLANTRMSRTFSSRNRWWNKKRRFNESMPWTPASYAVSGVPKGIQLLPFNPSPKLVNGDGKNVLIRNTVFRHYLEHEIHLEIMLANLTEGLVNGLQNAKSSYVRLIEHWWGDKAHLYKDLTGVFFTLPDVPAEAVGVPGRRHYIDFRIPLVLPVLEIEPGRIFMIPLPARLEWITLEAYRSMIREGRLPRLREDIEKLMRLLHPDGIPGPELTIPIEIVGHGKTP